MLACSLEPICGMGRGGVLGVSLVVQCVTPRKSLLCLYGGQPHGVMVLRVGVYTWLGALA